MEYIILLFFSISIYLASKKINTLIFKQSNDIIINIFIFTNFFVFIYLIFSYFFIFGENSKLVSYLIFFLLLFLTFILRKEILDLLKKLDFSYFKKEKILFSALFLYFFLILFPLFDEDSLRYHLAIASKINNGTFYQNTWIDYLIIGAHEFINSFSLHLKFEEISNYTNFTYLIFILLSNIYITKKYKVGSGLLSLYVLLASPYLISLLTSQKLFLLPCYIVTYSIAYLYLEKKNNLKIFILIFILNTFAFTIKATFLPYVIVIGVWSIYKLKEYKDKIIYICVGSLILFIFYLPIFYIKLKVYNDPFLIFFSINPDNYEWFHNYRNFMSNIRMDTTDNIENTLLKNLLIPVKLLVPLKFSDLSRTLGLGFLFIITINFRQNKNIIYCILVFIGSVIIIQSFQSRWFLPLLIFISIFANMEKIKIILNIFRLKAVILILVLLPLSLLSFLSSISVLNKNTVYNKIFNSHHGIVNKMNTDYKGKNIFTNINYFYGFDNYIPIYYPKIVNSFDKNFYKRNEKDQNFFLWVNYGFDEFVMESLKCKKYEKIQEYYFNSRRLYSIKPDQKAILYKSNC